MELKVQIKKNDGSNLDAFVAPTAADNAANSVAFINLVSNSIFSGVDVKLNNVSINSNFYTNPYIAYLQTILNYSPEALKTKLALAGFFTDHDFAENRADQNAPKKESGFFKRAQYTSESKTWTLLGQINNPVTMQSRYLIPLLPISVVFTKSKPEFSLKKLTKNQTWATTMLGQF